MIGYGAEDNHFVLELTYNYGIGSYQLGNDFQVCVCIWQFCVVVVHCDSYWWYHDTIILV